MVQSRRDFIQKSVCAALSFSKGGAAAYASSFQGNKISNDALYNKVMTAPKLFCTAYITPDAPGQGGQEGAVARYPIAIVPQDDRKHFKVWRDKVRKINPDIIFLAYQQVIKETKVPGPGHRLLSNTKNSWATYPEGIIPTVGPASRKRRIYDPRNAQWQSNFVKACSSILNSYEYDGLFLDNCTIFPKSHPSSIVRDEMKYALQKTISEVRKEIPGNLLVGNCRDSWAGLNGAMNEDRPNDFVAEVKSRNSGGYAPQLNMFQLRLRGGESDQTIKEYMNFAHHNSAFFGVAINYQTVAWYDFFDKLISESEA